MSAFFGLVSSTVQAVATATPAVVATVTSTPSPSPAVVAHANSIGDTLNALASKVSVADLVAAASAIAVVLQALVNKVGFFKHAVAWVQDVRRFALSVVIPTVLVLLSGLASNQNDLHLAPVVFLGAQLLFYVVKSLTKAAQSPVTAEF